MYPDEDVPLSPALFLYAGDLKEVPELPEISFHELMSLSPQTCGSTF